MPIDHFDDEKSEPFLASSVAPTVDLTWFLLWFILWM